MSLSIYARGIVKPDKKWEDMKAIWDTCKKANIDPPNEVWEFFNEEEPHDKGVIVDLRPMKLNRTGEDIYRIRTQNLRKDFEYIEFVLSY